MTDVSHILPESLRGFWDRLPHPIIGLAPMDGVTDAAFRATVSAEGAPDVMFTEFTSVGDVCRGPDHLLNSLLYGEGERPIVAQLYGKDPDLFYQAAHAVCELGFDGLDINMGCPSRNVAASGSGAGLIRTPDLAHAIMRAAREGIADWAGGQTPRQAGLKASRVELIERVNRTRTGGTTPPTRRSIPLSVKTRLGYDAVVIERWIAHLLDERPAAITVHGRTLEQMYRGAADWDAIARAARLTAGTGTLLLGNGDLQSMQEAGRRIAESGVQGVLVGRGTLGHPWFFRTKELMRRGIYQDREVDLAGRFAVLLAHARRFEDLFGSPRFPRMRKHLGWYCKGFPHAAAVRAQMVRMSSSADVERLLQSLPITFEKTPAPAVTTAACG